MYILISVRSKLEYEISSFYQKFGAVKILEYSYSWWVKVNFFVSAMSTV